MANPNSPLSLVLMMLMMPLLPELVMTDRN
jgi:hypothetical protein